MHESGNPQARPAIDPIKLERLARMALTVGVDLAEGQNLLIIAPLATLPMVRLLARHAYQMGAGLVTPILTDEEMALIRCRHASDHSFDQAPSWLYKGMAEALRANTARIVVMGSNPTLLAGQNSDGLSRLNKAEWTAHRPVLQMTAGFGINWGKVAYPTPAWAAAVFPDVDTAEAIGKLSDAIFAASRVNADDPVAEWRHHDANLHARAGWLNDKHFASLRFRGPATDLTVGLADHHRWKGGSSATANGRTITPNIPTEEVFTAPHSERVSGHARMTKPLAIGGTLIEGIEVRFEAGRLVDVRASRGEDILKRMVDTDEGAKRLGEVALVPDSTPISRSDLLYYVTTFDENAASHIAFGQCYADCFRDGVTRSAEEIAARGGNSSLIHVDCMIGSKDVDGDGVHADGAVEPVMRQGEWT